MAVKLNKIEIKDDLKEETICRLCLSNDAYINIFTSETNMLKTLMEFCSLSITSNDELPHEVCQACVNTLIICEEFKQKCIESDQELRNRLLSNGSAIKTEIEYVCEDSNSSHIEYGELKLEPIPEESFVERKPKTRSSKACNELFDSVKHEVIPKELDNKIKKKTRRSKKREKIKSKLCPICGKIIVGKSSVSAHIRTHDTDKPFLCSICNKPFRTKSHLNLHSSTHSENRDFMCNNCPKTFKTRSDLKRHILAKHEKPITITCDICGRILGSKNSLKSHMRVHSGVKEFECSECPQKFIFKSSLNIHFRVHSGEKPYQCKFCEARFSMTRSLRDHERLHTGETPYKCPCCPKAFNQLSNMKSHFRHIHRDLQFDKEYKGPRKKKLN